MKQILFVDDKPAIGKVLSVYLGKENELVYFEDPVRAIEWLNEGNEPALIISDIRMPKMTGSEFLAYLKSNSLFKDIPVVMLSSEESTTERINLLEAGAEDFILKPFNPMELKARIKAEQFSEEELAAWGSDIAASLKALEKHAMRAMVIETGERAAGRRPRARDGARDALLPLPRRRGAHGGRTAGTHRRCARAHTHARRRRHGRDALVSLGARRAGRTASVRIRHTQRPVEP